MNEQYNHWTVISEPFIRDNPIKRQKYIKMVIARCNLCQNEKTVSLTEIKTGKSKSCGCLTKIKFKELHTNYNVINNKDNIVQEFKNGSTITKLAKKYKSCKKLIGMVLKEKGINTQKTGINHPRYNGYKGLSGRIWNKIKASASSRNLEFTITKEYIWNLYLQQNKKCKFSNIDIVIDYTEKQSNTTASLDRIDSSKGYIEGNVQWVHKSINMMKQALSDQEFINWCTLIVQNRNPKLQIIT